MHFSSASAAQTERFGQLLGATLKAGDLVALRGDLGGGKTCFTRGVVSGCAPQSAHLVASPTFAIMNSYPGEPPVYHFDFYRLTSADDIAELGFEDYFNGDGVSIIEWAERLDDLYPKDCLTIDFEYAGDNQRILTVNSSGPRSKTLLEELTTLVRDEIFL